MLYFSNLSWFSVINEWGKRIIKDTYGEEVGTFMIMITEKANKLFKDLPLAKYELYPFCEGDINKIDITDDTNPEVIKMKVAAYNKSTTIPPCANKVEYYSKWVFDALIKKDPEIRRYIKKHFKLLELEHRLKPNEVSDYFFRYQLKHGNAGIVELLAEHKSVSYMVKGKCAVGSTVKNLIQDIEDRNPDMTHKILFKVDSERDPQTGVWMVRNFFMGNFLSRIGISAENGKLQVSNGSAHIMSECSITALMKMLLCKNLDDICNYIVSSYNNYLNKHTEAFFIYDGKEYFTYNTKDLYYGFYEVKRDERNIPYYTNKDGKNINLSAMSFDKYKKYKKWTQITMTRAKTTHNSGNDNKTSYRYNYLANIKQLLLEQNPGVDISMLRGIHRVVSNDKPLIISVSKNGAVEVGRTRWKNKFYSEHPEFATIDNYKLVA